MDKGADHRLSQIWRRRQKSRLRGAEEGFQEEHGGDLIDDLCSLLAAGFGAWCWTRAVEDGVGFSGGEALIEEVDDEGGVLRSERIGEGFCLESLGTEVARGIERETNNEAGNRMFAQQAGDGFEIGPQAGSVEREEGLGGEAEGIREGEADPAVTDIEGEDTRWRLRTGSRG